ncbi:uncharacterized protein LOC122655491 [Telopea speciosissima]|uniref:uncharacterized protein LOC122655491 n=1 Tax=Telopea speciosissima TaxID=54955 RepID=UPI001CC3984E|nr:uncharacterized protein LOC122655491 [Telopea speciosissima]
METLPDLYPLTSLQIGDIQSYISRAFLYFAPSSHKFLILVDNQPWVMSKHSRSTRIWHIIVTKYRMSPFTNTRTLTHIPSLTNNDCCIISPRHKKKMLYKLSSVINVARWPEKSLVHWMDSYKNLHGFIVFEVSWKDVRGINYLNELQTDTSLALEVKSMRKWEFNSINHALSCISLWFSGTPSEMKSLHSSLNDLFDADPHSHSHSGCCQEFSVSPKANELLFNSTCPFEVLSEDLFFDVEEDNFSEAGSSDSSEDKGCLNDGFNKDTGMKVEFDIASTIYYDNLLLLRFSNKDIPFKLRQIITSDLRLLTLLESGLPAWVIFLQSYPLFRQFYRPWMRPLVRTLYILISLVTVIIGFYDLYKNIPILKETLSHLCGPLFKWVEAWDMISRIRYLGTMLFLQNFEKAVKWFLIMVRTIRLLVSLLMKPLMHTFIEISEFMSPIWSIFVEIGAHFSSAVWKTLEPLYIIIVNSVKVLMFPFLLLYSFILTIVTSVYPVINSIWELSLAPIRITLTLANYVVFWSSNIYNFLKGFMASASNMTQLTKFTWSKPNSSEISVWHGLWKDLISKVFRALRSVIYGLVAFFTTCNRHRLSIYNHMRVFFLQLSCLLRLGHHDCHCQQKMQDKYQFADNSKECNRCK